MGNGKPSRHHAQEQGACCAASQGRRACGEFGFFPPKDLENQARLNARPMYVCMCVYIYICIYIYIYIYIHIYTCIILHIDVKKHDYKLDREHV